MMQILIEPKKIVKILIVLVTILTIASISGGVYKHSGGRDRFLVSLFDLDKEWNIPTWYSSISLLFCSFLLAIISIGEKQNKSRFFYHWICLSIIFLILSLDEAIQFHEQTIRPLRNLLNLKGIFYFSWVVPAAAFLMVFVFAFLKFVIYLPKKIRFMFVISGFLYVAGAMGMELIGGYYTELYGQDNITYTILTNIEEIIEMTAIVVFIYSLLFFIKIRYEDLRIRL